jgi:hypothetical protein
MSATVLEKEVANSGDTFFGALGTNFGKFASVFFRGVSGGGRGG